MYPNLSEIIKYHPYHITTFASHAGVTVELLEAALDGKEELKPDELFNISRYDGIPLGVIKCPHLIRLSKTRKRHRDMVEKLVSLLYVIEEFRKRGSKAAESFMKYDRLYIVNLELAFLDNRGTYGMYLGAKERIAMVFLSIKVENSKPRGLREEGAAV